MLLKSPSQGKPNFLQHYTDLSTPTLEVSPKMPLLNCPSQRALSYAFRFAERV